MFGIFPSKQTLGLIFLTKIMIKFSEIPINNPISMFITTTVKKVTIQMNPSNEFCLLNLKKSVTCISIGFKATTIIQAKIHWENGSYYGWVFEYFYDFNFTRGDFSKNGPMTYITNKSRKQQTTVETWVLPPTCSWIKFLANAVDVGIQPKNELNIFTTPIAKNSWLKSRL